MSTKVVVTGGAGFIGSHLARELSVRGHKVTIVDNLVTGHISNIADIRHTIEFVEADINDTALMTSVFRGADVVYHLAAIPSVPRSIIEPELMHQANIHGTFSVLIAAKDAGVRRVVYSASSSFYGDNPAPRKHEDMPPMPKSPYAVQKMTGEYYTMQFDEHFGLEGVALRYFNIFGPNQDPNSPYSGVIALFVNKMLKGERPRINGDGSITRDYTFVSNAVDANIRAAMTPEARGKIFNVACGKSFTLNELVLAINRALGTSIEPEYGPVRTGDILWSLADISRAEAILGYKPLVDFEDGIKRTVIALG